MPDGHFYSLASNPSQLGSTGDRFHDVLLSNSQMSALVRLVREGHSLPWEDMTAETPYPKSHVVLLWYGSAPSPSEHAMCSLGTVADAAPLLKEIAACLPEPSREMLQRSQNEPTSPSEVDAVKSVLNKYTTACERRDFEAVSELFSHDPDLVLINVDPKPVRGWQNVAEVYKGLYAASGEVRMRHTNVEVKMLGNGTAACLVCDQSIQGAMQGQPFAIEGVRATLVLEKEDGAWRIVHGHWSLASAPQ